MFDLSGTVSAHPVSLWATYLHVFDVIDVFVHVLAGSGNGYFM